MRIVLDAMGSDDSPGPELAAAVEAASLFQTEIILTGPEDRLKPALQALPGDKSRVSIVHAPETITMEDKGLKLALKAKRRGSQTSMAIGMDLVKNGEAATFITAGNTGGALATAFYRLGTIPGVERPALTALFPTRTGFCVVADIGANPDAKPEHVLQFAVMGSVYANKVRGIANPRVGLLSNGEETGKGNELVRETTPLLQNAGLNFSGNIEAKELFTGQVDVAVTDGFTGNILLKTSEAVSRLITDILKEQLMSSTRLKMGGLLAKPAFAEIKRMMDPSEIGAAPLLGIDGLVFIGHGRSDARALVSAIRTAKVAVDSDLLGALKSAIQERLAAPLSPQLSSSASTEEVI